MSKRDLIKRFSDPDIKLSPSMRRLKYSDGPSPLRSSTPRLQIRPRTPPVVVSAETSSVESSLSSTGSAVYSTNVRGASLTQLTDSNFFEKRLLWADSNYWSKVKEDEQISSADITQEESDKGLSNYLLRLPKELQKEFFADNFQKNLWVIRAVHIIMILIIVYGIFKSVTKSTPVALPIIRGLFIFVFIVFFVLSFLRRDWYQRCYQPLMLIGVTLYTPTVIFEFYDVNATFIIFFMVLVYCGLYATGCLMFLSVLITNIVNIVLVIAVLLAVGSTSVSENMVFLMYLLMVFVVGASFLYLLEKSRKQNFVFSSRLEKQSKKIYQEKAKSERLLLNILPPSVAKTLKKKRKIGTVVSEKHQNVTVLIADIVGFTEISSNTSPKEIVSLLNELFSSFDYLCTLYGVEKVKTIGDAYVAVAGIGNEPSHAESVVDLALEMQSAPVLTRNCLGYKLRLRIGVASGPVLSGVIGIYKWCYDLYGSTVTEATSMETHGAPSRVLISESTLKLLPADSYNFEERIMETQQDASLPKCYFVTSKNDPTRINPFNYETNSSTSSAMTPREDEVDEEEIFEEKSKLNKWTLHFTEKRLENIYSEYRFARSLVAARVQLIIGLAIHFTFSLMDLMLDTDSFYKTWWIYYLLGGVACFILFGLTFWKYFFSKVFEPLCVLMVVAFGIITLVELAISSTIITRYVFIRTCVIFLYVVAFFPLGFISVIFAVVILFIALNGIALVSPALKQFTYNSDYIGLLMLIALILFSKYRMENEIRKTFVLKRRVRFKGVMITQEQKKSEQLLLNILPAPIAKKLMETTSSDKNFIAESYKEVSCMFIKILGIEEYATTMAPSEMLGVLNTVFSEIDRIATSLKLEKIKTIGTTYMVVGGLVGGRETHLWDICDMALRVRKLVVAFKNSPYPLDVQIGINIGPCVAGIIGTKRISFDLWGDAVNTASRMQSHGLPGYIQVTEAASILLKEHYLLQERGRVQIKGKGTMTTYWLTGQKSPLQASATIANFVALESNQEIFKDESPPKQALPNGFNV